MSVEEKETGSPGELVTLIDERRKNIRTRSFDISFNEILDMHANDELVIDPAYQRLFRWSEAKQSRFIESLVLEMPIPPLYVIEIENNVYELIDGLQRISTWLHFRGQHPDRRDEVTGKPTHLRLQDCDIVKELNGLVWEDFASALKIRLKRHFVRVEVIRQESDPRLRYYMFKRLNTGGEILSSQEIRNCTVRLLDPKFNDFINELAEHKDFQTCVQHSSVERAKQMYREELVLRFFALKNDQDGYEHRVDEFLTHYMESVSDPDSESLIKLDYPAERRVFEQTFATLAALGDTPFAGKNNRFSVTMFEALTIGIQSHLARLHPPNQQQVDAIRAIILALKADPEFDRVTVGGGLNYASPLRRRIEFVEKALASVA